MVQLSTPGVTPNRGMGPPWGAFLSNYFDLLLYWLQVGLEWIMINGQQLVLSLLYSPDKDQVWRLQQINSLSSYVLT